MRRIREVKQNKKYKNCEIGKTLSNIRREKVHQLSSDNCLNQCVSNENGTINVLTAHDHFSKVILTNLDYNRKRLPRGRRYPNDVIDFFFLIKFGPNSYNHLRWIYPIPSIQTLYKRKRNCIKEINNQIIDKGNSNKIINSCLGYTNSKIPVILSMDAIEIALFQKVDSKIKNIFILFMIPLNIFMKPFVIKALPHETGKANKKTVAMLNGIIKELFNDELPISLQYKAVDGDPGYNKEFDFEFTFLFEYFSKHEIEGLFQLTDICEW
ncbi:hypothetical protein M9Y10_019718 [Tritrichomonas musculus]|uniref:Initiator binding domain-containing protein n=1 Tax=Tritrichomonas musculus TaxID=1915356 RepID=A0ABR2HH78_9EUKA